MCPSVEYTVLQSVYRCYFLYFQVIIDDRLPLFICTNCNKKLTNANNFRQQCITANQILLGIYENESKGNPSPIASPIANADSRKNSDEDEHLASTPVIRNIYFCCKLIRSTSFLIPCSLLY